MALAHQTDTGIVVSGHALRLDDVVTMEGQVIGTIRSINKYESGQMTVTVQTGETHRTGGLAFAKMVEYQVGEPPVKRNRYAIARKQ